VVGLNRSGIEGRRLRHQAAVSNSLLLAEHAAARGDYEEALSWLAAVEATGDVLSAAFQAKRHAWRRFAREARAGS
jgi:hypothetical protein